MLRLDAANSQWDSDSMPDDTYEYAHPYEI